MKWLRLAGQYINTGIVPQAGYKVTTNVRMVRKTSNMPLFGSRSSGSSSNNTSFNMFYLVDISTTSKYRFRADYGGTGDDNIFTIDVTNMAFDQQVIYGIEFGKISRINGTEYTSPTDTIGSSYPILIGSINSSSGADTRKTYADFAEFIISNASGVEVFHGMPVQQGSTEYSTTPAPSNCYYDLVSQSYKVQSGGSGVIWYEDTDDNLTVKEDSIAQSADYGLKVLAEDDQAVAYMNSKYPLFGSDISNNESQFKTYQFTLTGFNSEPNPSFPGYVYDSNWYYGEGTVQRTAQTIDTGFKGGKIKSILVQHDGVTDARWQARARQRTRFTLDGTNINSLLNPKAKNAPAYTGLISSNLIVVDGSVDEVYAFVGQQGGATWDTLASFNGGTVQELYWQIPQVILSINDDGILTIKTLIPYKWTQRAFNSSGYIYEARWLDWAWFQGVTVTVTILNTPYEL